MRMLAYLLGIICVIAAVVYFTMPANELPSFMPGHDAKLTVIHYKHAYAAIAAAVVLFAVGWFMGRR